MNEKLAVTILQILKNGESFGISTIKTQIDQMEQFFDLTLGEYRSTVHALLNNKYLLPKDNNERDCYKLNPERNCIEIYLSKISNETNATNVDEEIKVLTVENLRLSNELIPLQKKDLKGKIKWGMLGFLGGSIITNWKEVIQAALGLWKKVFH